MHVATPAQRCEKAGVTPAVKPIGVGVVIVGELKQDALHTGGIFVVACVGVGPCQCLGGVLAAGVHLASMGSDGAGIIVDFFALRTLVIVEV